MADQLVFNNIIQDTAEACVVDLTPPVFAGISALVANGDGTLTASWSAASDANSPITYEVYIQEGTATGLFNVANLTLSVRTLSAKIFALASGVTLNDGATYFVGVRARDPLNNVDSNLISMSAISSGVVNRTSLHKVHGAFSIGADNMLSASFWLTVDDAPTTNDLGTASYTIYDKDGNNIGITESGIVADVDGVFRTTPVLATAILDLTHYLVSITIQRNSQDYTSFKVITLGE